MEEDIRKQGMLFIQQQRFGKKWKRVWCVLYRESTCSISRLEFFECKDGTMEKNDKNLRKQQEHKKVIRLADCIRVSEVEMDGCPRDTGPFLVETTEKIYVFAAERQQLDDWTHKLCEIAFPMNWVEHSTVKRGSLHRGNRVDEDEGMEDNSLYSGRETVRDYRVCVRRTEASDRCRLKGDGVLRAGTDALLLLDKTGDVLFTWPYRYLRRFGRDKSTFSFEAGRRCDSGEGSFEFDTKQGNFLFQAVEAAINLQRISVPHRQTSAGGASVQGPDSPHSLSLPSTLPPVQSRTPPLPQVRTHVSQSSAAKGDCVYSMVSDPPHFQASHHKDKESAASQQQQQQRPPLSRLEPPIDKTLTGVKSLTLETRGLPVPRKNQVKMISSCPLPEPGASAGPGPGSGSAPHPRLSPNLSSSPDEAYSKINLATTQRSTKRGKRGGDMAAPCTPPVIPPEPEYSLPFDTIAKNVMANIMNCHQAHSGEQGADPLYDSIDEMKIRNIFPIAAPAAGPVYGKQEHIYDEPEGCAAAAQASSTPPSVYDDPEEMRRDAWMIMGTTADPKGHEYPYNPRVDDYAVPKRPQRAFLSPQSTNEEEEEEEGEEEEEERREGEGEEEEDRGEEPQQEERRRHSPYNNVMVKMS